VKIVKSDAEVVQYVYTDHLGRPQKTTGNDGAVLWDTEILSKQMIQFSRDEIGHASIKVESWKAH